jgi:hypothetical protein
MGLAGPELEAEKERCYLWPRDHHMMTHPSPRAEAQQNARVALCSFDSFEWASEPCTALSRAEVTSPR